MLHELGERVEDAAHLVGVRVRVRVYRVRVRVRVRVTANPNPNPSPSPSPNPKPTELSTTPQRPSVESCTWYAFHEDII